MFYIPTIQFIVLLLVYHQLLMLQNWVQWQLSALCHVAWKANNKSQFNNLSEQPAFKKLHLSQLWLSYVYAVLLN